MTHLSSSWQLWKLQAGSGQWFTRLLTLGFGVLMVIGPPWLWPAWGPILAPLMAIPVLWVTIAGDDNAYRAFGMNRARAAVHSALTIVPIVIVVATVQLAMQPTSSGVIGAALSVLMGGVCIYWSDPTTASAPDAAGEGAQLRGRGGFAWRVLWREALIGSVLLGVAAGLVEVVAYALP